MTFRGTLPPGQAAFAGAPEQQPMYGDYRQPQQQPHHPHQHRHAQQQQPQPQPQQQGRPAQQLPPQGLYANAGQGHEPARYGAPFLHPGSSYQQQQRMAPYGLADAAFAAFDAGAPRFAPVHQHMHFGQQGQSPVTGHPSYGQAALWQLEPSQQAIQPPTTMRPPPPPQLQQQRQRQRQQQQRQRQRQQQQQQQQQHAYQSPSPQLRQQPSPQLRQQPSPRPRQPSTGPPPRHPQQQHRYQHPLHQQQQQQQQQPSPNIHVQPRPTPQQLPPQPQPQPRLPIPDPQPPREPQAPSQQEIHFVNPQDILQPPPPPPIAMGNMHSLGPRAPEPAPEPSPAGETIHVKPPPPPEAPGSVKASPIQPPSTAISHPSLKKTEPRVKSSPHSSVSNSPALSARSPSITKKSPAMPPKPRPINTGPLMMAIAEDCLDTARASVHDVAMSLHPDRVDEYQKLVATSLSCLEATLANSHLSPRQEARVRLRYAATLQEETENLMEAEMALTKGITLCDKHRLIDLKYCMQYLMLKVLFQRNHKAALKAVDGHISDCEAFKHVQWYYAFRLLKATFYMEMGNASDAGALDNIRSLQHIATTRGDKVLSVLASVLEGLSLLKAAKDGSVERIRACLAQAAKFQLDASARVAQLDVLALVLDFAASLHHLGPDATAQKLRLLQKHLDDADDGWHNVRADFAVPVKKQPANARTVSDDTAAIVRAGEPDTPYDYLVMSFMTKMELRSLVFTFSGLASLHKQGRRSTEFWREGVKILDSWDSSTAGIPYGPPISLATAIRQRAWRTEAQAYLSVLLGLVAASHCQWATVRHFTDRLATLITPTTQPAVRLLSLYLTGIYHQGTGDVEGALRIFLNACFAVPQGPAGVRAGQREIALLAGLNRLWIMQHPSCRNDRETQDLLQQLHPHCSDHWNIDLRTAWHNVVATLETEPPQQLNQQKQHIQAAMAGSKVTANMLGAAVTLCIMRSRFFENVIGEQALKSARAASMQAQRSGNVLLQSVADGMLAQSYEVQGQREESRLEWEKATKEARDAFAGS